MKTRIKHHDYPGDVSKQTKIEMREHPNQKDKLWKKTIIIARERAILNERTAKEIEDQIDSEIDME